MLIRTLVLAGCIAAAGCNVVFGLDATELMPAEPPERDNDGDGIVNPDDNCVLVTNPDQADADEDALGDACDPCVDSDTQSGLDGDGDGVDDGCDSCLSGRNHDEDGDGIGDGCDACPGTPDAQADGDGDGIGDQCDADPSVQHRVFFDGFGPPDTAWNTGFKPWKDGYVPATPAVGSSTYDEGPWHPSGIVLGARLRITASVMVPPPELFSYEQRIGISLRSYVNGQPLASCEIRVEQTNWVRVSDVSAEVVAPGRVHFELAFVPSSTTLGHSTSTCTIAGKTLSSTTLYEIETPYAPSLVANVAAEFEWIDMIE